MKEGPALTVAYTKSKLGYGGPILLGVFLYVLGLILFESQGLGWGYFVNQQWIGLVIIGISWVSLTFQIAFKKHKKIYNSLETEFEIKNDDFTKIVSKFFKTIHSDRKILIPTSLIIIGFMLYIASATTPATPVPKFMEEDIFPNAVLTGYLVLLAILSAYHFGMGAFLLGENVRFIRKISKYKIIFSPLREEAKTGLYRVSRFSFYASITWFVGAVIAVIIFRSQIDPFTSAMISLAIIVGSMAFILPQLLLRNSIKKSKQEMLDMLKEKIETKWGSDYSNTDPEFIQTCLWYDKVKSTNEWPIDMTLIKKEFLSISISISLTITIPLPF